MSKTDVAKLAKLIERARDAYYNGNPIMEDSSYDAIEDELRKADPSHPLLAKVGAKPTDSGWPKVRHEIPMGSLKKAQDNAEMNSWIHSMNINDLDAICVSEKLDGISIGLRYEKGKLVQGLTRGNGETGEDITPNVRLMKGAVKQLPPVVKGVQIPDAVYVRGEIVVLKSDFEEHFRGDKNPRNTASGTAKRQSNADKCRYLTIKAYQWLPDGMAPPTKLHEFECLQDAGFKTSNWFIRTRKEGVQEVYQEYIDSKRDSLDYLIDGLVVELDGRDLREGKGIVDGRPKGAVAYKFPHEVKPTTLRNIRWQVGNSGRVTPVAEFKPVDLAGATVIQASLHNVGNIHRLAGNVGQEYLFKNDTIMVARRNDVIPYVEEVLETDGDYIRDEDAFLIPAFCPSCKGALKMDGEYLICPNTDGCEAQATGAIKRWVKKIDIKHVGDALIETLVDAGLVSDIADLYTLDPDEVENLTMLGSDRRVGAAGRKAINNLNKKMALPIHVFVGSLGIPLIGRSMAKTIVDGGYDTLSKMLKAKISGVAGIPGVGRTKAEGFVKGFKAKAGLIAKLVSVGIVIQAATGPLRGKIFCLTGFRDSGLTEALERAGGTVKSGVSKKITHLILQDVNSRSGKAKKAREYNQRGEANITLIDPDEAWKMAKV